MTFTPLQASPLWERVNKSLGAPEAIDLFSFKSSSANFNISLWNPQTNGVRYLKTLLYRLLSNSDPGDFALYAQIPDREFGRPTTVRVRGQDVCLDYYQALDEAKMIFGALKLSRTRIIEIGPGYGRTCHTLMSLVPDIVAYVVVDLDPCLILSQRYLKAVLPADQFAKIEFVGIERFDALQDKTFDLAINIDSFADMMESTVRAYLEFIDIHCAAFYCKNPIGKYLDASLDGKPLESEAVKQALETGILREVIDIFDDEQIAGRRPYFLNAYRPARTWQVVDDRPAMPWSFYHHAVYRR